MIQAKRLLGLVPARGGSVGIPRKNIKPLGDRPLIAWSIEAARRSRYLDRVVVSTDDAEIAECAREQGAETPFMRPAPLATNSAQGVDVVLHALDQIRDVDAVVLLQPTSPFRSPADIDGAIEAWSETGRTVVSVAASAKSPYLAYHIVAGAMIPVVRERPAGTNRQELPAIYYLNGAVYVAGREELTSTRSFLTERTRAFVMPAERSIDLDDESDWQYAEFLLRSR